MIDRGEGLWIGMIFAVLVLVAVFLTIIYQ
jgi:tetrahydromethanopterin S-methyltransferase subunit F